MVTWSCHLPELLQNAFPLFKLPRMGYFYCSTSSRTPLCLLETQELKTHGDISGGHDSQSILAGNLKHPGHHLMLMGGFCGHEIGVWWAEAPSSLLREPPWQWCLWFPPGDPFLSTDNSSEVFRQQSGECADMPSFYLPNKDPGAAVDLEQ